MAGVGGTGGQGGGAGRSGNAGGAASGGGSGAGPSAGEGGTQTAGMGGSGATAGSAAAGAASTGGAGGPGPFVPTTRAACTAPDRYPNLFTEVLGLPAEDVQAKMTSTVQQLFHGTPDDQAIYFELSSDPSQAYVQDIYSNDVRSEGQSYGMFIAVQMNMKTEFDKLWAYAKACMQQPSGVFAWQMNVNSCTPISRGQAPDGDEYFAEALRLASKRWGDDGAVDYAAEARKVMAAVAQQDFVNDPAIVKFSQNSNFSDPSYVLPLFYSEWACFDTANATLWKNATSYGRTYFQKVVNAKTGLAPYQSNFDGSAYSAGNTFNADAWRVPMNVMADYVYNGVGTWPATYAATHSAFWVSQNLATYGGYYTLDGTPSSSYHGPGLAGVNAMLAFGLSAADAKPFLQAAWDTGAPTGQFRYYDGTLYMLSMLYLTGTFSLFY
ncbi:MAG TPA: glycosyl hydrolase family 8 [Polyangiaceae bacterium]|nr:glycosyl hydrolase family 8 [Polyangiaceae bacterium]